MPQNAWNKIRSGMSDKQQSREQKSAAMDLRYQNGKEVVKGGILGAFIGLAVIVPG